MADDFGFYDLAVRFPRAILALLGLDPSLAYRGEAKEVKAAGRFDAVLSPEPVVLRPANGDAPRIDLEFQGRHDPDLEARLLMKIAIHRLSDPPTGKSGPRSSSRLGSRAHGGHAPRLRDRLGPRSTTRGLVCSRATRP